MPSIFTWKKYCTRQPSRTAEDVITSLRLSTEVAFSVVERIFLPREPKKPIIHSLTLMEARSTIKVNSVNSTAAG